MEHPDYIFAAVPYLNAAPLTWALGQPDSGVTLTEDHPSRLAAKLLAGEADAALIPVVDLFRNPDLTPISGIGIAARRQVESVLLKCNRPLVQVRRIAMDPASATSNRLAAIVLKHRLSIDAQLVPGLAPEEADAYVLIGDRALTEEPAPCGDQDLAELWRSMTNLPFVFAVWAHRRDHEGADDLARIAQHACERGLEQIDAIAADYAVQLGLSTERCVTYLTERIRYRLGTSEMEGLQRFWELLREDGLLDDVKPGPEYSS